MIQLTVMSNPRLDLGFTKEYYGKKLAKYK